MSSSIRLTFVAVAEELSFTRAAERLFVGQQAVSKTVRRLERELAVGPVERTTHDVRLTAAGVALLQTGRPAIAAADAAFAAAQEAGRGLAGTIRVGASPAVSPLDRHEARARAHERRRARRRQRGAATDAGDPLRPRWYRLDGAGPVDLLLAQLAAAGAQVEAVESRGTGSTGLTELAERDAVALMPAGWPAVDGVAEVQLAEDVTLPLLVLWPTGVASAAVQRVRDGMTHAG